MLLNLSHFTCLQIELCKECIDWATDEKRIYLRQALEVKYNIIAI